MEGLLPPATNFPVSKFCAAWLIPIPTDSGINIILKKLDMYCQDAIPQEIMGSAGEVRRRVGYHLGQDDRDGLRSSQ